MKTFIVEVIDESKTEFVETLLNEIDGITVKEKKEKVAKKKKREYPKQKKKDDLFANSFGMWKDTNITAKSIRSKAWPKRV